MGARCPVELAIGVREAMGEAGIVSARSVVGLAEEHGLVVERDRLCRSLRGLIIGRTVYVRDDLTPHETAFVVAHEYAHHLMGHGNMLLTTDRHRLWRDRDERDANVFAGTLLWGFPFGPEAHRRVMEAAEDGMPAWPAVAWMNAAALMVRHAGAALGGVVPWAGSASVQVFQTVQVVQP